MGERALSCGCVVHTTDRVPVERLFEGDLVRAVEHGPRGEVIDANRLGWTLVQYPWSRWTGGVMSYKHGKDRLILDCAASREERSHLTKSKLNERTPDGVQQHRPDRRRRGRERSA